MEMVLNIDFTRNSEERGELLLQVQDDIHKALGTLADIDVLEALGHIFSHSLNSAMVNTNVLEGFKISFCFVRHHSQSDSDISALETDYLRQVGDAQSELFKGEITCSIDPVRTLSFLRNAALSNDNDMSGKQERYKVGDKISFLSMGDRTEECEVVSALGASASATVFKVKTEILGICALKVFRNEKAQSNVAREASLLLKLNYPKRHPNVMGMVWFGQQRKRQQHTDGFRSLSTHSNELLFLVEHVGGGTLHDWICDERLYHGSEKQQQRRLLSVAHQLACGVQHFHSIGILHQDVKPSNVLMTEEGRPVLADVGLSQQGTCESGRIEAELRGATLAFSSAHVRDILEAYKACKAESARFLEDNKITQLDDIWCVAATMFSMFEERGWRKGRSFAAVWPEERARMFQPGSINKNAVTRVPVPTGLQSIMNQCFSAGTHDQTSPEATLTMEAVANELGKLLQEPPPKLCDGLEDARYQTIMSNLAQYQFQFMEEG
jgi:serine/threonine protein kinase